MLAYPTDLIEMDRVREKPETKVLSGTHGLVLRYSEPPRRKTDLNLYFSARNLFRTAQFVEAVHF